MFGISNPLAPPTPTDLSVQWTQKNRREQKDRVLRVPRKTQKRREQRGLCEGAKNDGYVRRALPGRGSRLAHPAGPHGQLPNAQHDRCAKWVLVFVLLATFSQPGSYLVLCQTRSACSGIFQGHEAPEAPEKHRSQRSGQPAQVWLKLAWKTADSNTTHTSFQVRHELMTERGSPRWLHRATTHPLQLSCDDNSWSCRMSVWGVINSSFIKTPRLRLKLRLSTWVLYFYPPQWRKCQGNDIAESCLRSQLPVCECGRS